MNRILHLRRASFALIAVCLTTVGLAFNFGTLLAAEKASSAPQGAGRLIIARSANLGPTVIGISIDGVKAVDLNYNRTYDAPIPAGPHVITVVPSISLRGAKPMETRLTVEAGKIYKFTAKRKDIQIVLQ
jgi:hypothetical protein